MDWIDGAFHELRLSREHRKRVMIINAPTHSEACVVPLGLLRRAHTSSRSLPWPAFEFESGFSHLGAQWSRLSLSGCLFLLKWGLDPAGNRDNFSDSQCKCLYVLHPRNTDNVMLTRKRPIHRDPSSAETQTITETSHCHGGRMGWYVGDLLGKPKGVLISGIGVTVCVLTIRDIPMADS